MTLTLHNSQVYCSGSCSGELAVHSGQLLSVAKLGSEFYGVGLYCATRAAITRQQIFKGSIQVTIVGVYCMLFLNTGATPSDF